MKQNHLKELMTVLLLLCCTVASAADFEVGGLYYNILSSEDKTVEVTSSSYAYSGAVTIPASITYNSITYSVTSIGESAFYYCSALTSIEIPSSVTSIGYRAFWNCSGLTSIEIPSSVTSISDYTFSYCYRLTSIEIPSSVTSIGKEAFYNCNGLTSIEIPSSVTSIGDMAFYRCYGLTSIVVDEGNSVYDSRNNCNAIIETASNTLIAGCVNTIIPSGVTSIGDRAFYGCSSLTSIEIPAGVTSIGGWAFYGCSSLTSVEIPEGVTSIGNSAFDGCSSLTSIEIPEGVTSIGEYAFFECTGLTSIVSHIAAENLFAPSSKAFNGIDKEACTLYVPTGAKSTYAATDGWKEFTNIVEFNGKCGDNAYWALNEETGALTIFGTGAMYNYDNNNANRAPWYSNKENISTVSIGSGITVIGERALARCLFTSIEIPSSVTSIGNSVFSYCYRLTSIEIPNSVTSIGRSAFWECTGLTSINIPEGVTSIGNLAFRGCTGLTSIVVDEGNSVYDSRGNCNAIIETASNTLIAGCKNTIIPASVTSIGDRAFYDCDSLTSIVIPASVISIGDEAFYDCTGLTSVTIGNGVTSIGGAAFYNCTGLTSIVVGDGNTVYDSRNNCNAIIETASNTLILGCKNTIIPASVTSIGGVAFNNCAGLTSIVIPSSVTSIGGAAFYNCRGLTSIEIPASVTSIGDEAFLYCDALTSVTIGNGVTSIGDRAFCACDALTSIEIPSSVTSIGNSAFCDCSSLTSIEIPSSVTSIGNSAFCDCTSLTSVTIGNGVTSIGEKAFSYCYGLASITSHIAAENLFTPGKDAFYRIDKDACTLYVPAGAKSTYAATDGWKEFTNIVEMSSDGSDATAIESVGTEYAAPAVYYDLSGRRVENPTKGIYIVNGRKVFIK